MALPPRRYREKCPRDHGATQDQGHGHRSMAVRHSSQLEMGLRATVVAAFTSLHADTSRLFHPRHRPSPFSPSLFHITIRSSHTYKHIQRAVTRASATRHNQARQLVVKLPNLQDSARRRRCPQHPLSPRPPLFPPRRLLHSQSAMTATTTTTIQSQTQQCSKHQRHLTTSLTKAAAHDTGFESPILSHYHVLFTGEEL